MTETENEWNKTNSQHWVAIAFVGALSRCWFLVLVCCSLLRGLLGCLLGRFLAALLLGAACLLRDLLGCCLLRASCCSLLGHFVFCETCV